MNRRLTVDAWLEFPGRGEVPFGACDERGQAYYRSSPGEIVKCRVCGRLTGGGWRRGMAGKTGICATCVILDDSHKAERTA